MRVPANRLGFISVDDLDTIEDFIEDLGHVEKNLRYGENAIAKMLAYINLGQAQRLSGGPLDPRQTNRNAAWKIPVRRISEDYYKGWVVRRVAPGFWQLRNESREAYFIEFGIHQSEGRVRRPIRKLSLIQTLRFADRSRVGHRVWEMVWGPMRRSGYGSRGGLLITRDVQSPGFDPFGSGSQGHVFIG